MTTVVVALANKEFHDFVVIVIVIVVIVVVVVVGCDVMYTTAFASTGTTMTTHRYRTEFITDVRMSGRRHRRRHRRGGRSGRY